MIVARFDERPEEQVTMHGTTGTTIRWLINKDNGARTFAMRRIVVQPGGKIPLHTHPADHEIYVLSGEGAVLKEDGNIPFQKDMFIYVPPNIRHGFQNTATTPLVFLCVIPLLE